MAIEQYPRVQPTPDVVRAIPRARHLLSSQLDRLDKVTEELYARLESVLGPPDSTPPTIKDVEGGCDLAVAIDEWTARVHGVVERLSSYIERLQV